MDAGFLLPYEYMARPGVPSAIEFGPLFGKRSGQLDQCFNQMLEKEVDEDAMGLMIVAPLLSQPGGAATFCNGFIMFSNFVMWGVLIFRRSSSRSSSPVAAAVE